MSVVNQGSLLEISRFVLPLAAMSEIAVGVNRFVAAAVDIGNVNVAVSVSGEPPLF